MAENFTAYVNRFAKLYAIVAAGILIAFAIIMMLAPNFLTAPILRGALIGGSVGAIMWPIMGFAQSFLEAEGRKTAGSEAWRYATRFAVKAMLVNLGLAVIAVIFAFGVGGIRADEIGIAFGVAVLGVAVGFGLQILMFRLFIWSAFKGAEKRAAKMQGG